MFGILIREDNYFFQRTDFVGSVNNFAVLMSSLENATQRERVFFQRCPARTWKNLNFSKITKNLQNFKK